MGVEAIESKPVQLTNESLFLQAIESVGVPNAPSDLPPSLTLYPWQLGHLPLDVAKSSRENLLLTEEISWDQERGYFQYKGHGSQVRIFSPNPFVHYVAVNEIDSYFPSKHKIVSARNTHSAFIYITATIKGATALVKTKKAMANDFFWWLRNAYSFRDRDSVRDVAVANGFGLYLAQTQGLAPDESNPDFLLTQENISKGLVFTKL